jgi:hypothetical protein
MQMKKLVSFLPLLIILAVSGCAAVPVDETQSISKPVIEKTKEDLNAATIIFLEKRAFEYSLSVHTNVQPFAPCIKNKILKHNPNQKFIPFSQVTSKLFPDLPKERAPSSPEDFSILLDDEKFYTDISAMGIRYLIFIGGGKTEMTGMNKYGFCGAAPAPGAAGCLLLMIWDKETQLSASILDVKLKNSLADNIGNTATGKSWLAIVSIFPVGMPDFTRIKACNNIGNRIGKILLDKSTQ